MRLPDFIIGGAPRSATTWLCEVLDLHPDIHLSKPFRPEPKFFLVDTNYEKGISEYAKLFEKARTNQVCGEKSTNYLESEVSAERISRHLPRVKLVFMLRDPVERAISNYFWSKMNGMEIEEFERALELEDIRESELPEKLRYTRPHAYFSRGLYAQHLGRYLKHFQRDQIHCVIQEDAIRDPRVAIANLHEFLGVAKRGGDALAVGVVNASEKSAAQVSKDTRDRLKERYAVPNEKLAKLLGLSRSPWA